MPLVAQKLPGLLKMVYLLIANENVIHKNVNFERKIKYTAG